MLSIQRLLKSMKKYGTHYHENLKKFLVYVQENDLVVDGAMTDPKGNRGKAPHDQTDADMFLRIKEKRPDGIIVRGAKCHQTGSINSHWHIVMPTISMGPEDKDFAVSFACQATLKVCSWYMEDSPAIRESWKRAQIIDVGNAKFGGQECLVVFDDDLFLMRISSCAESMILQECW